MAWKRKTVPILMAAATLPGCKRQEPPAPTSSATTPAAVVPTREPSPTAETPAPPGEPPAIPKIDLTDAPETFRQRLETARNAAQAAPNDAKAVGELGMLCYVARLPTAARACFSRAATLDRKEVRWPYYLGIASEENDDSTAALAAYEEALLRNPESAPAMNRVAGLVMNRNPLRARRLYQHVIDKNPGNASALCGIARMLRRDGKSGTALRYARRSYELAPEYAEVNLELSILLKDKGKPGEDAAYARRHVAGAPAPLNEDILLKELLEKNGSVTDLVAAAGWAIGSRNYPKAFLLLHLAVGREPNNGLPHSALGALMLRRGLLDEAAQEYRRAREINPNDTEAASSLGIALVEMKQFDEAERVYREVLAHKADDAPTLGRLGLLHLIRSKLPEAVECLEALNKIRPGRGDQHVMLGVALACTKRFDDSAFECSQAAEIFNKGGGVVGFTDQLVRLLAEQKQIAAATSRPGESSGLTGAEFAVLGNALMQRKLTGEAALAYSQAISIDPGLSEPYTYLLRMIREAGAEKDEAELLSRAVAAHPNEMAYLRDLAWLLATARDDTIRDGKRAKDLAENVCKASDFKDVGDLRVLAAAYAEQKDFANAIDIVQTAKKYNPTPAAAAELDNFLETFRRGDPIRRARIGE